MTAPGAPPCLVVIPAWNEQDALPGVVAELADHLPEADVLVVDDGSSDATVAVARAAGAEVLQLPYNLGVGGAMRAGFAYALRHGYRVVVQVDADGQHNPADVPALLAALADQEADIMIGARFAGVGDYRARGPRRWAMSLLSAAISRVAGERLTDTTSGFKAVGPRALALFAQDYPAEYLGDTVEALVTAARSGLVIRQHPVAMRPRAGGTPSHGPLKAAVFLARAALALLIALMRPRRTLPQEVTA